MNKIITNCYCVTNIEGSEAEKFHAENMWVTIRICDNLGYCLHLNVLMDLQPVLKYIGKFC